MIINPALLYPEYDDIENLQWRYFEYPLSEPRSVIQIYCGCNGTGASIYKKPPKTVSPMLEVIALKSTAFTNDKDKQPSKRVLIWTGQCEKCSIMHWTCNQFDWIAWMNDEQMIINVLKSVPIQHVHYERHTGVVNGVSMIVVHKDTEVRFVNGKIERVR